MPELEPGPKPAEVDTAQLEEIDAHVESAQRPAAAREQAGVHEPVRHAELQAEVGVEPQAWQPPAADVSPEYEAQTGAEMDEPEIEL